MELYSCYIRDCNDMSDGLHGTVVHRLCIGYLVTLEPFCRMNGGDSQKIAGTVKRLDEYAMTI